VRDPSQPSPRNEHRTVPLDGVCAIAAAGVLCFHVWLYRADRPRGTRTELLDQVMFHTNVGFICFFVLSGYLLYGAFVRAALTGGPAVVLGPSLYRRAARIVPAAWVCGAVSLVLY
jgi:peptidoglycan/LPS O-acetylase OafA/YrhL